MFWHELSWPQLDRVDRETPVVIPLGSCEQHGHHLPLYVDTIQIDAMARRVEQHAHDRVLVLPTLWLGSSHHHKDFVGTVIYADIIRQIGQGVLNAGFRRLFFLNGHGGNRSPAENALAQWVAEDDDADDAYLVPASWWEVGRDAMNRLRTPMRQRAISHACEFETSLMLFLRPDLVDLSRVQAAGPVLDNKWFHSESGMMNKVSVSRRFHRLTKSGSMGEPASASEEKGKVLLEGVVDEIVAFLDDFSRWPHLPKITET